MPPKQWDGETVHALRNTAQTGKFVSVVPRGIAQTIILCIATSTQPNEARGKGTKRKRTSSVTLSNALETAGHPRIVGTAIERPFQQANRMVQSESSAVTINPERVVRATVKIVKKRPRTVRTIVGLPWSLNKTCGYH